MTGCSFNQAVGWISGEGEPVEIDEAEKGAPAKGGRRSATAGRSLCRARTAARIRRSLADLEGHRRLPRHRRRGLLRAAQSGLSARSAARPVRARSALHDQFRRQSAARLADHTSRPGDGRQDDRTGRCRVRGSSHLDRFEPAERKGRIGRPSRDRETPEIAADTRVEKGRGDTAFLTPPDADSLVAGEGIETTETARGHNFAQRTAYWALSISETWAAGRSTERTGTRRTWTTRKHGSRPNGQVVGVSGDDGPDVETTRSKLVRGLRRSRALRRGLTETRIVWAGAGLDMNDLVIAG